MTVLPGDALVRAPERIPQQENPALLNDIANMRVAFSHINFLFSFCCCWVWYLINISAVKFDHFCPWVGNAVGALNHKFFVLFVGYTMCSCILSLFLLFIRAMHCGWVTDDSSDSAASSYSFSTAAISGNSHSNDYNNELGGEGEEEGGGDQYTDGTRFLELHYREECHGFYNSYATLILLIVSVVFMIFTCCMLMEQIEAIETNSSKIARMKMRVGQAGTELARVTEEFNEMFGGNSNKVAWHWFLPTEVEFPRGMQKVVLGYDWDETFDPVPYEEGNGGLHTNSNTNNNYDYNNTNGVSTGRGFDEELGSSIELTSTASKTILLSESGNGLNHIPRSTSSDGEEGSLLGTSVSNGRHTHLTQRSNSRGPETRLKEAPGTLT